MVVSKTTADKWEYFIKGLVRVLDYNVLVRVKGKDAKIRQPWLTKNIGHKRKRTIGK